MRNYGYTKLLTFLQDKCSKLDIAKENSSYTVNVREMNNVTDMHKEIASIIQKNGGSIDNLSVLYDQLKKKYPSST